MARVVAGAASSGDGERLAGVAAGEDVDGADLGSDLSDVGVDGDAGEPLLEQPPGVGVVLAEPGGAVTGNSEVEAAAAGEE